MVLSKKNILLLFEDPKFKDILINNVVVFENEVVIDITINNPTLQAKKKSESLIKNIIDKNFNEKIDLTINTKVEKPKDNLNQIKGKPIPGIKNVIAIASG